MCRSLIIVGAGTEFDLYGRMIDTEMGIQYIFDLTNHCLYMRLLLDLCVQGQQWFLGREGPGMHVMYFDDVGNRA